MFLHDKENDIYHLTGTKDGETRCGEIGDFWVSLIFDNSHKGKECERCLAVVLTPEMLFYAQCLLEDF